jgi:thioredoxin reductase
MASSGAVAMEFTDLISKHNIPIHHNCRLEEITDNTVICSDTNTSDKIEFPVDTVLLALGMSSRHDMADSLRRSAPETEVFVVGDAIEVGNIGPAIMSAFRAAAYI